MLGGSSRSFNSSSSVLRCFFGRSLARRAAATWSSLGALLLDGLFLGQTAGLVQTCCWTCAKARVSLERSRDYIEIFNKLEAFPYLETPRTFRSLSTPDLARISDGDLISSEISRPPELLAVDLWVRSVDRRAA